MRLVVAAEAARSAPAGVRALARRCALPRSPDRACGRAAPAHRQRDRKPAGRGRVRSRAAAERAQRRQEPAQTRSLARGQPEPFARAVASGRRDDRERKRGCHPRRPPGPDMLCAFAARLPSIVRWIRRNRSALGTGARIRTRGDWRGPRNPALTLVYQGKQPVNPLSKQTDFLAIYVANMCNSELYSLRRLLAAVELLPVCRRWAVPRAVLGVLRAPQCARGMLQSLKARGMSHADLQGARRGRPVPPE